MIIVSGTPGTGKTVLAKRLAKELKYAYIDGNALAVSISEGSDKKRKCKIVDTKKLNKRFIELYKKNKNIIIDSHLSHYLPKRYADLCIITKCGLKALKKRLEKRRYSKKKVRENLDCEIFEICLNEAKELGHKVLVVDTSKKVNIKRIIKKIELNS